MPSRPLQASAAATAAVAKAAARRAGLRWVADTQPGITRAPAAAAPSGKKPRQASRAPSPARPAQSANAADGTNGANAANGVNRAHEAKTAKAVPTARRVRTAAQPVRPAPGAAAFDYSTPSGRPLQDAAELDRIRKLAIPPAWQDVWICPQADGHLQATGRDARGRKQYRYHADWQAGRGQTKFDQLRRFGQVLPRIRDRVQRVLARGTDTPTRTVVLATLVRLLDTTWLRIGNPEYARDNGSYGLSTLRNRHAGVEGRELKLSFVGKSGVRHEVKVADRRVARVVQRCRELPGQELFQYVDDAGEVHRIGSADVNDWLAEAAGMAGVGHDSIDGGKRVTAKDFRTWHGSVQALELTLAGCAEGAAPCRPQDVLTGVARRLGNTPAVCRKAYIHPRVLALGSALNSEDARAALRGRPWAVEAAPARGLSAAERRLLALLRSRGGGLADR